RLRGNRQATVTLRLTHAFLAAIGHRRWSATLSVQSSTNGYPVTVTARF
ncbi:MAG: hypothetical protein JO027_21295, partial [Solirubrobacterales bacterium]|nr:hypothetical protein [Solirubrobacterales bacterium]